MSDQFNPQQWDVPDQGTTGSAMAKKLRDRARAAQGLTGAYDQAHQYDMYHAVAKMSNNPDLAEGMGVLANSARSRYKPVQMGQQGFMLPGDGSYSPSPMYEDEMDERRGVQRELAQQRTDQQREAAVLRETLARNAEEGRNDRAAQQRQLMLTLAGMRNETTRRGQDIRADTATAPKPGKTLPASQIDKLTTKESIANDFGDLSATFKTEWSGNPIQGIAEAQNFLGRHQPLGMGSSYADQANWWQNYQEKTNQMRHELFGSALTATEFTAFKQATIVPGMKAEEIQRRLAQQQRAATLAYNKLKGNYARGGYNVEEFADLPVPDVPMPGGAPRPKAAAAPGTAVSAPQGRSQQTSVSSTNRPQGQPAKRIKFDAQGNQLP